MADISAEAMGARRQWSDTFIVQEGKAASGQSVLHKRRQNQKVQFHHEKPEGAWCPQVYVERYNKMSLGRKMILEGITEIQ